MNSLLLKVKYPLSVIALGILLATSANAYIYYSSSPGAYQCYRVPYYPYQQCYSQEYYPPNATVVVGGEKAYPYYYPYHYDHGGYYGYGHGYHGYYHGYGYRR